MCVTVPFVFVPLLILTMKPCRDLTQPATKPHRAIHLLSLQWDRGEVGRVKVKKHVG